MEGDSQLAQPLSCTPPANACIRSRAAIPRVSRGSDSANSDTLGGGIACLFGFHVAVLHLLEILEALLGSAEGIPDGRLDVRIGVPLFRLLRLAADSDLLTRNADGDVNLRHIPGPVLPMWQFNRNPATDEVRIELLKPGDVLADKCFDFGGGFEIVEHDFQWNVHETTPLC